MIIKILIRLFRKFVVLNCELNRENGNAPIKTAFATILFNDVWYLMDSETPLERRFADLTLLIRSDFRQLPLYKFYH